MNQFFSYQNPSATARVTTGHERNSKKDMVVDFNPFMSTFNKYYNGNERMCSIMNQFYQDFNIINNTVNSYSTSKPSPLERRLSALESKDYRKRFGEFGRTDGSRGASDATASTNFEREPVEPKMFRSNTYSKLPDSRKMDFYNLKPQSK